MILARLNSRNSVPDFEALMELYRARMNAASEEEKKNRGALERKLCAEKVYVACANVAIDARNSFLTMMNSQYENYSDREEFYKKLDYSTPEARQLSLISCLEAGMDCYQALSFNRGTEVGDLLMQLTENYCDSGVPGVCQNLIYELESRNKSSSSSYCAASPGCTPPTDEENQVQIQKMQELASRSCDISEYYVCTEVVEGVGLSANDPRVLHAKETVAEACENRDQIACNKMTGWAALDGDMKSAHLSAQDSCNEGNSVGCLMMAKIDFKKLTETGDTDNFEVLRPALQELCNPSMNRENSNRRLCDDLRKGYPINNTFLSNHEYDTFSDFSSSHGNLRDYLDRAW